MTACEKIQSLQSPTSPPISGCEQIILLLLYKMAMMFSVSFPLIHSLMPPVRCLTDLTTQPLIQA